MELVDLLLCLANRQKVAAQINYARRNRMGKIIAFSRNYTRG